MNRHLRPRSPRHRQLGYTLVEALVAGIVLMIGISAASQLTLTVLTQDEMNRRSGQAMNYLENAAHLYRLGLDRDELLRILPDDGVVNSLNVTPSSAAVPGLGNLDFATLEIEYNPAPATDSWTGNLFTAGNKNSVRKAEVVAYRSSLFAKLD